MTVRRLLTTIGLMIMSLFLVAFQGEPQAPTAIASIPWLVWLLLLLVALGLFYLAWMRRDVDAFDTGHDDHHDGHTDDGHDVRPEGVTVPDAGVSAAVGGAGIAMADADVHVTAPDVDVDRLEADLSAAVADVERDVGTPDVDVEISAPGVALPDADLNLPDTDADLSDVNLSLDAPEIDGGLDLDAADVDFPEVDASLNTPDASVPDVEVPDADMPQLDLGLSVPDNDLPEVELPDADLRLDVPDIDMSIADSALDLSDIDMSTPSITVEGEQPDSDLPNPEDISSSVGMRERPFDFLKVEIPDTLPSADAAVRDTMEFKFGEDTPGEVVQRPHEGERYDPSLMRAGEDADVPALDVPDLGMPALDDGSFEKATSETPGWYVGSADTESQNLREDDVDDSDDDLALVEGIGPKIASLLRERGIRSFRRLAATRVDDLRAILDQAGLSRIADPGTWAEQAQLAAEGAMDELKALQEKLKGGRQEND